MTSNSSLAPEAKARMEIDRQLVACGWVVQDRSELNLYAGQGVAVREFIMAPGHGRADSALFIDQKAVGAIEAKPPGTPLAGVEPQSAKYSAGLPRGVLFLVDRAHLGRRTLREFQQFATPADGRKFTDLYNVQSG